MFQDKLLTTLEKNESDIPTSQDDEVSGYLVLTTVNLQMRGISTARRVGLN